VFGEKRKYLGVLIFKSGTQKKILGEEPQIIYLTSLLSCHCE